jgi:hypothetical protein
LDRVVIRDEGKMPSAEDLLSNGYFPVNPIGRLRDSYMRLSQPHHETIDVQPLCLTGFSSLIFYSP